MLDVKKLFTKIAACCYASGSYGGWTYKKYGDGTFVANFTSNVGATGTLTQLGSTGIYYSVSSTLNFPSIGITAIKCCIASCIPQDDYLMAFVAHALTTSSVALRYMRFGSGTAASNISYSVHIEGTWA